LFQTLIYKNFNFQNFILIKIIIIIFLIFNKFKKNINVILNKYIIILILIISIFLLLEIVTGYNIRQLTSSSGLNKFSGIYGRHKIAGSIILYLVILISILSAKKNYRNYLTYVFCGLIIFLSGQRNPFIKFFLISNIFLIIYNIKFYKNLLIGFMSCIIIFFIFLFLEKNHVSNNKFIITERVDNSGSLLSNVLNRHYNLLYQIKNFKNESYSYLYLTAFELFKQKPIFGNGIGSFRITCKDVDLSKYNFLEKANLQERCNTHPHNPILEILSEVGLFGFGVIIYLIFKITEYCKKKEKIYYSLCLFITYLFPLLPSGSFFGNVNLCFFSLYCGFIYRNSFKNK